MGHKRPKWIKKIKITNDGVVVYLSAPVFPPVPPKPKITKMLIVRSEADKKLPVVLLEKVAPCHYKCKLCGCSITVARIHDIDMDVYHHCPGSNYYGMD
jgi:hypothetical protein